MQNWLVYPLTIGDQQQHIELSEHLLSSALPGEPATLYWSQAQSAGLVLGFSQKSDVLNPLAASSLPIYHRRAGGTAVLVGPTLLSLDLVLPAGHPLILPDLVESYRWFGEAWTTALASLDIPARIVLPREAHEQRALRKDPATREYELLMNRACYGSLSSYEVVVGQQKVVGLDMIRRRTGTLLQAGVLLEWHPATLAWLLGHTPTEQALLQQGLQERAVGLDTLLGRVIECSEVIHAFESVILTDECMRLTIS